MVQIVAQKGPLAVNVDAVLWHDYIGEVFFDKNLWFVFHFRFYSWANLSELINFYSPLNIR